MAVRSTRKIRRVRASIHVDRAEGVRPADVEEVDALRVGELDEFDTVRRLKLPRDAGRMTARMRLEFVDLAVLEHLARPRLERQLIDWLDRRTGDAGTRQPDALFFRRRAAENHA